MIVGICYVAVGNRYGGMRGTRKRGEKLLKVRLT